MRAIQRSFVVLVASAVAVLPLLTSAPASAGTPTGAPAGGPAAAVVPCLTDLASARTKPGTKVPAWRQHADHAKVTQADLDALPVRETRARYVAREVEPRLPATILVPVYAHVVKGKHRGERPKINGRRIGNMIQILNNSMVARQSAVSAKTRYRFYVKKITQTSNDGWFHAWGSGPRTLKMKRKLHRGNARTLNIYFNGGGPQGQPLLGSSRFPWQYASAPKLDGVTVNVAAIPGGRATGYNLGDTLVHETGHWLGLFHTFQGGCSGNGDLVADTPAEAEPSFYCQTTRDTCPAPGLDPVRNFMDYSLDSCMMLWTPAQTLRMDAAFEKWRY